MRKLNVQAAHNKNIRGKLRSTIAQCLYHLSTTTTSNCTSNLTMEWQALSSALLDASQSILGNLEKCHQEWLNDNSTDNRSLVHDHNAARNALLSITQLLAQFLNHFPLFMRHCSVSYFGWRTIGGCRRLPRYRAMLMSMMQRTLMTHQSMYMGCIASPCILPEVLMASESIIRI